MECGVVSAVISFRRSTVTSAPLTGGQWIAAVVRAQNSGLSGYAGLYFWNFGSPELMVYQAEFG